MNDFFELAGFLAFLFAASVVCSWVITVWVARRHPRIEIPAGGTVRLRASGGMYRTRILSRDASGIRLAAPLMRDAYVPLRVGEKVTVEAAAPNGVLQFRSHIAARAPEDHSILVALPREIHRVDRRDEPRRTDLNGRLAQLDQCRAEILDVSALGVRLKSSARVSRGDRVRLDLEGVSAPIYGYVLEVLPGEIVRIRFESPVCLPPARISGPFVQ